MASASDGSGIGSDAGVDHRSRVAWASRAGRRPALAVAAPPPRTPRTTAQRDGRLHSDASVSPEPAHHPPGVRRAAVTTITHQGRRLRMFDSLSDRLRKTLAGLTGRGRVTEADVDAAMREVRLALLEADVNFKVVKDFVARVRERAIGAEILDSLTAGQQVVKIVHEELTALLSAGDRTFQLVGNPAVIALVGLQGSGKTTTAAKLAKHIVKLGRQPLLVAADPYRPAAADQLETLGNSLNIAVYRAPVGTPTVDIARQGVEHAKRIGRDTVIIDTAGRLTIDDALMAEIRAVADATKPVETLLVVDAMTGQEAVTVAQGFAGAVPVTGLVLTKIDGDARGGAALSIGAVTGHPGQVPGHRREDRRARGVPPRPPRRPDPRHGRRRDARRSAPRRRSTRSRPRSSRSRSARARSRSRTCCPRCADAEDGPDGPADGDDPGHGRHGQGGAGRRRPGRPQAGRGHHPVDDAARAPGPRRAQRVAPPPDRARARARRSPRSTGSSSSSARCRS